jgi:hypothetical protein
VNASDIDFEKFLNSISLRYENQLAKCFEHDVDVLTKNMKNDIKSENKNQNTIWNIYVQKIRDAKPDYQQILHIIKEKKYIETDVTTRIVRNYVEEKNLEVFLDNQIIVKKIVKNIADYVGVLVPKEVDIWLRQGIPLGAEDRFQLIFKFNTNVKNLFGDAVAFYFLYGPQRFMNLIENNMKKPPIQSDEEYEKNFLNSIIKEVIQNPSTISPTIRENFQEVFFKNLKINVLKKQTSLKDFQITTYGGVFDDTIEFLNIQSVTGYQRQKYSFILKKRYLPEKANKKVPSGVFYWIFISFLGIILEFILQYLFFSFFSVPSGFF